MKNLLSIFSLIILLIFLFVGKAYYDSVILHTTFNPTFPLQENITDQLVDNFFSTDVILKKAAAKSIKKILMRDLEYSNWIDYIDYTDVNIYPMGVRSAPNDELIIALNLSKDEGIIGIYKLQNLSYIYVNKIEGLTFIKGVTKIKDSINNRVFLVIEEALDESLGAYFVDNFIRIYSEFDSKYQEVYRQSLDYEAYYYEKWTDPSIIDPKWFKLSEKSIFDYIITEEGKIVINVSKNIAKYQSNTTVGEVIPENFMIVTEKNFDVTSIWSEEYLYFIQGIGRVTKNSKIVGIIENSEQTPDSLLNSSDKYYKVIDKNGKIDYIVEKNLEILKEY